MKLKNEYLKKNKKRKQKQEEQKTILLRQPPPAVIYIDININTDEMKVKFKKLRNKKTLRRNTNYKTKTLPLDWLIVFHLFIYFYVPLYKTFNKNLSLSCMNEKDKNINQQLSLFASFLFVNDFKYKNITEKIF